MLEMLEKPIEIRQPLHRACTDERCAPRNKQAVLQDHGKVNTLLKNKDTNVLLVTVTHVLLFQGYAKTSS